MGIEFAVVIPVYNKKPHISRCITSVLNQSVDNFEIIVIDDNSTDGSFEELQKFNDSRLRVYRRDEPGPGGYAARNMGVKIAKAAWIAFLDADDEWYPDHLEKLGKAICKSSNSSIASSGYYSVLGDQKTLQKYYLENKSKGIHNVTFTTFLETYLKGQRFGDTSAMAVKKEIISKVGGFPAGKTKKGGDLYTWIKIFSLSDGVWSPHIGANIYRDSVNKVTQTSYFNIDFLKSIVEDVDVKIKDEVLLKRYLNSLIIKDYKRFIFREKRKGFNLLRNIYFIEFGQTLKSILLSLTPSFILWRLIKIKRLVSS